MNPLFKASVNEVLAIRVFPLTPCSPRAVGAPLGAGENVLRLSKPHSEGHAVPHSLSLRVEVCVADVNEQLQCCTSLVNAVTRVLREEKHA